MGDNIIGIPDELYNKRVTYLITGVDPDGMREKVDVEGLFAAMQWSGSLVVQRMRVTLDALLKGENPPPREKIPERVKATGHVRDAWRIFIGLNYDVQRALPELTDGQGTLAEPPYVSALANYFAHLRTLTYE